MSPRFNNSAVNATKRRGRRPGPISAYSNEEWLGRQGDVFITAVVEEEEEEEEEEIMESAEAEAGVAVAIVAVEIVVDDCSTSPELAMLPRLFGARREPGGVSELRTGSPICSQLRAMDQLSAVRSVL